MTPAQLKAVKRHPAYNLNMSREEEVCITLTPCGDLFTLDPWGCRDGVCREADLPFDPSTPVPLGQALDRLKVMGCSWWAKGV